MPTPVFNNSSPTQHRPSNNPLQSSPLQSNHRLSNKKTQQKKIIQMIMEIIRTFFYIEFVTYVFFYIS